MNLNQLKASFVAGSTIASGGLFSPEESRSLLLDALGPLGDEVHSALTFTGASDKDALLALSLNNDWTNPQSDSPRNTLPIDVKDLLEKVLEESQFPGIGVGVMTLDGRSYIEVAGERRHGSAINIEPGDRWHLGSISKTFTATLCAILDRKNIFPLSTTIGSVFPEYRDEMPPGLAEATVHQLLLHRGGLPLGPHSNPDREDPNKGLSPAARRDLYLKGHLLRSPLMATPGERHIYSNECYVVIAAMIDRVCNKPFEEVMKEHIAAPLGLSSLGFGRMHTPGKVDGIWGHNIFDNGHVNLIGASRDLEIDLLRAGAGDMHVNLKDLLTFLREHLKGTVGQRSSLLPQEWMNYLFSTPYNDVVTPGWYLGNPPFVGGNQALTFTGNNGSDFALAVVVPRQRVVIAVTINAWRNAPNDPPRNPAKVTESVATAVYEQIRR